MTFENPFDAARESFYQTINLKLQQFHAVVRKGTNAALTGDFIEELVRGFIRDWIQPCLLLRGTLYPFDLNPNGAVPLVPQIDGIVFDPRQGPSIVREGNFIVADPRFCPGIIEIKTSDNELQKLEERLKSLYQQYYCRGNMMMGHPTMVMGIVIHDPNPEKHSSPDWLTSNKKLYEIVYGGDCPIFILFKEVDPGMAYEPFEPGIEAMMKTIFSHGWAFDPRLAQVEREFHTAMIMARVT